jgi:predicted small secreted protein
MRTTHSLTAVGLLSAFLLVGCSNNTGPVAGALNVSISSPHRDDGALLLSVNGGPVDSVESVGFPVYAIRTADSAKFIVTGSLGSGTIARIHIPDGRQGSRYSAKVGQAAARVSYAPRDPATYSVTLIP